MKDNKTCSDAIAVIEAIRDLCNEGNKVMFEEDWGGDTMTVWINQSHTHVGVKEEGIELLIENLKNALIGGPGLSFA